MKSKHIIKEYSTLELPIKLSDDDRVYLQKAASINENTPGEKRFYIDELKSGVRFKSVSYVGTIELSSCTIQIQPKFNEGFYDVMRMLAFAEQMPFAFVRDSKADLFKSSLFILFAEQFISLCEPLKMKLKKEYITYSEDLKNVRGRIQMLDTARKHYLLPKGVVCEFDELTTNILENQILLTVLKLIHSHAIFRKHRQLTRLIMEFENICDQYSGSVYPSFQYNRMNHQYESAHKLGKLLFESMFIDQLNGSGNSYMTLLINMNELFEKFVVRMLKKYLPKYYQVIHGKRITDAITQNGSSYRRIIPDIIVKHQLSGVAHVIDTKYKSYDSNRIATSDIFQLSFYAQYIQSTGPYISSIIHPVFDGYTEKTVKVETNTSQLPGEIAVHGLKIEEVLELITSKQEVALEEKSLRLVKSFFRNI